MELMLWKYTEETQSVLKELNKEIEKSKNEILEFGGLLTSPFLEREYCRALGYLDGLKYLTSIIEDSKENEPT